MVFVEGANRKSFYSRVWTIAGWLRGRDARSGYAELVVLVISKAVASYAELNSVSGIAPPSMEASATKIPAIVNNNEALCSLNTHRA